MDTVHVSSRPALYMAPLYLAQEAGYFSDARLQVEFISVEEFYQNVALLAGGQADVAFGALSASLPSAVSKGAQIRIVAGRRRITPGCSDTGAVYGNRSRFPRGLARVQDLKELRGRTVALNSRSNVSEFYLETLLDKAGLTEDDLRIETIRSSEAVTAAIGGRVDAFLATEQFSAQPISDDPRLIRGVGLGDVLPGFQFNHMLYGKNLLGAQREVGQRFSQAFLKGVREFARGTTPKFLDDFARNNGFDVQRARASCRDAETLDGSIDRNSIRLVLDWFAKKGFCPSGMSVEQLIDTGFVHAVDLRN